MWKLEINVQITKLVIFDSLGARVGRTPVFVFKGTRLEVVSNFLYLQVLFNLNGNFNLCKNSLYTQAQKAMYSLLRKSRCIGFPIGIQIELLDRTVVPILLYGCEVCGCENNDIIEKLHIKFCRVMLNISSRTPRCMTLGELGRLPLQSVIDQTLLNYWGKITSADDHRLNKRLYMVVYNMYKKSNHAFSWISHVKITLNNCGLYQHWLSQNIDNLNHFKTTLNRDNREI